MVFAMRNYILATQRHQRIFCPYIEFFDRVCGSGIASNEGGVGRGIEGKVPSLCYCVTKLVKRGRSLDER
jgi:hypothetical protein